MSLVAEVRKMEGRNTKGTKRDRDSVHLACEAEVERKFTNVYDGICAQKKDKWHRRWLRLCFCRQTPLHTIRDLADAEKNFRRRLAKLKNAHCLSLERKINFDKAEQTLAAARLKWESVRMQKEEFYTRQVESLIDCRTQFALEIVQMKGDLLNLNAGDKEATVEQRIAALFAQHRQQQRAKRDHNILYEAVYDAMYDTH